MNRAIRVVFTGLLLGTPMLLGMALAAGLNRGQPWIGGGFCLLLCIVLASLVILDNGVSRSKE